MERQHKVEEMGKMKTENKIFCYDWTIENPLNEELVNKIKNPMEKFMESISSDVHVGMYLNKKLSQKEQLIFLEEIRLKLEKNGLKYRDEVVPFIVQELSKREYDFEDVNEKGVDFLLRISNPGFLENCFLKNGKKLFEDYKGKRVLYGDVGLGPINRAGTEFLSINLEGEILDRNILLYNNWQNYTNEVIFSNEAIGRTVESFVVDLENGKNSKINCFECVSEDKEKSYYHQLDWNKVKETKF
jgi:hypothetical protein